ncbi:MAG: hypothetical protein F6K44_28585 [Moorea sp. SIO3E2]|nr:hypothetical protein [Moorena sp. SIO3E2]
MKRISVAISYQLSAISYQLSAISYQLMRYAQWTFLVTFNYHKSRTIKFSRLRTLRERRTLRWVYFKLTADR